MPAQIHTSPSTTRTIALWISLVLIIAYSAEIICPELVDTFSLKQGSSLADILTYPLLHANLFHLLANLWTFLLIIFLCPTIHLRHIMLAHIMSLLAGILIARGWIDTDTQIIGYSAPIYSLLAIRILQIYSTSLRKALSLFLSIVTTILLTSLLPHVSFIIHVLTFTITLIIVYPFTPTIHNNKNNNT